MKWPIFALCWITFMAQDARTAPHIVVASTNNVKITAVQETLKDYPAFANATIQGIEVPSNVAAQPLSLEETIRGAVNRAKAAFKECNLSFGIESGIMQVPYSKTGYMNTCVCAIYDGTTIHLGLSPAFECPHNVVDMMVHDGLDMNQAFKKAGLTNDPKLGSGQGALGILTKGRMNRLFYSKQAVAMAMIGIDKP